MTHVRSSAASIDGPVPWLSPSRVRRIASSIAEGAADQYGGGTSPTRSNAIDVPSRE